MRGSRRVVRVVLCFAVYALSLVLADTAAAWNYPRNTAAGSGDNPTERTITASNVGRLTRVWRGGASFAYSGGVTVSRGRVFYGTGDDVGGKVVPGDVVARSLRTGALLWRTQMPGDTMSTPVENDGLVFVAVTDVIGSGQGRLYALAAATGRIRWWRGQYGAFADVSVSPVVHNGRVYILWEDEHGHMSALDEATGATIWRHEHADGVGPLAYADHRLIDTGGGVYSLSGKLLGGFPQVQGYPMESAIANGMIYEAGFEPPGYGTGTGTPVARAVAYRLSCVQLYATRCRPVWSTRLPAPPGGLASTIAVTRRRVFIPTSSWTWQGPGGVVALDARTGALRWQWTDPADHEGWQVSVGGSVAYLITRSSTDFGDAHLVAFAAAGCGRHTCDPLGSWRVGQQSFSTGSFPVIQDGTVLVWNDNADGVWAYRVRR